MMRFGEIKMYNTEDGERYTDAEFEKVKRLSKMEDMGDVLIAYRKYCEEKNMTSEWKKRLANGWYEGGNWGADDDNGN